MLKVLNSNTVSNLIAEFEAIFNASPYHNLLISIRDDLSNLRKYEDFPFSDSKYPPFNLYVENENPNTYILDFAVAGFSQDELQVQLQDEILTITGSKKEERVYDTKNTGSSNSVGYMYHQGLAYRSFTKSFILPENSKVSDVTLKNGILSIKIIKEIPESHKPVLLEIKSS